MTRTRDGTMEPVGGSKKNGSEFPNKLAPIAQGRQEPAKLVVEILHR